MPAPRLGLIANHSKPAAAQLVRELAAAFAQHGLPCQLEAHTAALLGQASTATPADLARTCDLLVVLGGDGTILQLLHDIGDQLRPILGINLGSLGFLTCVSATAWQEAVRAIVAGDYTLSQRTLLQVSVHRAGAPIYRALALNDAVISRGEFSRLIKLDVAVDGATLSEYHADGLIVATPTGSTAYSLSAGGPVLTPDSAAFLITPICPHVLTMRPVMISDHSLLEIAPTPGTDNIFLALDGQHSLRIDTQDRILIRKAPHTLSLAMLPGMSFFEVLRQKLKWSGTAL